MSIRSSLNVSRYSLLRQHLLDFDGTDWVDQALHSAWCQFDASIFPFNTMTAYLFEQVVRLILVLILYTRVELVL